MNRKSMKVFGLMVCFFWTASTARAGAAFEIDDQTRMEMGFWTQGWYQFVEDGAASAEMFFLPTKWVATTASLSGATPQMASSSTGS